MMLRRIFRAALAIVASAMLPLVPAEPARAADAKPLVGDWTGQWKSGAGSSDSVYLVVENVQGEQVYGTIFIAVATPGTGYYNRELPFHGVFDGTELRFWLPPAVWLSLKVVGTRMHGSIQGQQTFGTIDLE